MLKATALLTIKESQQADKATISSGLSGEKLMENAGMAVASLICEQFKPCKTLVVCGTGNNGGDGIVITRLLKERGWPVAMGMVGNSDDVKGDARKVMVKFQALGNSVPQFTPEKLKGCELVVDAIFGTGLTRDLDGDLKKAVTAINDSKLPVISVDVPSGINADSGAVMGVAVKATHTVTFVRAKPGHVLLPGKVHTGRLHIFDIGISGESLAPDHFLNEPRLWYSHFPLLQPDGHKYTRGHTLVIGGTLATTGATRLAALSALRAGSGLVSVGCTPDSLPVYASSLTSVMTKPIAQQAQLTALLDDKRITSVLIGPGSGISDAVRDQVLHILSHKKPTVIDADAISAFQQNPKALFQAATGGSVVLTPHEGEFVRLFTKSAGSKPERVLQAAQASGCVVLLKGSDTTIAAPDGRVAINANAPAWLATAGTGDVLAGIISGLMAQGMPAFEAACAGVWIHGETANIFGPGMISEDMPGLMPQVMRRLYQNG